MHTLMSTRNKRVFSQCVVAVLQRGDESDQNPCCCRQCSQELFLLTMLDATKQSIPMVLFMQLTVWRKKKNEVSSFTSQLPRHGSDSQESEPLSVYQFIQAFFTSCSKTALRSYTVSLVACPSHKIRKRFHLFSVWANSMLTKLLSAG